MKKNKKHARLYTPTGKRECEEEKSESVEQEWCSLVGIDIDMESLWPIQYERSTAAQ
jgi:hypothetical protein